MPSPPLSATRSGAALAVGSVVSGLLAYVFFSVATRALGAAEAAPVSVLWAWWGFAAAGVTFPVQHWVARSVAADGGEGPVRAALPRVWGLVLVVAAGSGLLAWLLREPLFGTGGVAFPLLVAAVTGLSGLMGLVRGLLAARGRLAAVAAVLVAENGLRCLASVVLVAAGSVSPVAYGVALLVGYAACLARPSAWLARGTGAARPSVAFLGGAAGGQLVGQAVLTGGPVLLALAGGAPAEVTALFAGLALFRAPYTLAIGQVSALTTRVTDLVVGGEIERVRRFHRGVVTATVVAAPPAALVGWLLGPPVLRLVFGADAALDGGPAALLAVGTTFAVAGLVLTVLVMAHDRAPRIPLAWVVALVPGVAAYAVVDGSLERVVVAFLVVEVGAWLGLVLAGRPQGFRDVG
jgi:O-antigen/teichoic acid export membrane protein